MIIARKARDRFLWLRNRTRNYKAGRKKRADLQLGQ
jgi:hypothetical protein